MTRNDFVGCEHQAVTVKQNVAGMCVDGYENFGWTLEGRSYSLEQMDSITLRFKRDRRLRNKAELTRLQHQFDAHLAEVSRLEARKQNRGAAAAMGIGVIGTAFMVGAVFAIVGGVLPLGVALAIPGAAGWALPYLAFRKLGRNTTAQVAPLLEQQYDEIYNVCERASGLLAV